MSIATAIQDAKTKISAAYSACDGKGATMPSSQNLSNLAATINSIVTDIPSNQIILKWVRTETSGGGVTYSLEEEYVGTNYTIPQWKYSENTSLLAVFIPEDMTFGYNCWAFNACSNLQYINLEHYSKNVNQGNMFADTALCMPLNMPNITGKFLWKFGRTNIPQIISLGTITSIEGGENFINCKKLKNVNLPDTLINIGWRCFEGCDELETVTFNNIKTITGRAFYYCTKLNITLPQSITQIDSQAFSGCESLSIDVNLPNLTTLAGNSFDHSGITSVSNLGSITTIPGGSTLVGAFCHCENLQSVVLPSTLVTIESGVFGYDTSLTTVTFSTSITTIKNSAFYSCESLVIEELSLPNLTTLEAYAFAGCKIGKIKNLGSITRLEDGGQNGSVFGFIDNNWNGILTEVRLPGTLTYIGNYCFAHQPNLVSVYCYATTPPSLQSTAFNSTNSTFKIYVPSASVNAYKTATNWSSFASRIQAIS